MNVDAVAKRLFQRRNIGDMGQHAQFDLAVIEADQPVTGRGDERLADAAAFLGPDRDVLQVRIGRGQPPGLRPGNRV